MKRVLSGIILILCIVLALCGCDNTKYKTNGSGYNYVTDCQLTKSAFSQITLNCNIAKCETGYYTLPAKVLYYVEKSTMNATPLCSKSNCMHDNENCNAYLGVVDNIAYSDGYIYYKTSGDKEHEYKGYSFIKMAPDGSQKEEILYVENWVGEWIVHKGNIYYCVKKYTADETTGLDDIDYVDCYIYGFSIDKSAQPKEVYFAQEIEKHADISSLIAYGDNLYFDIYGMKRDDKKIEVMKSLKLSLKDLSTSQLLSPSGSKLSGPMYLDNMLIFSSDEQKNGKYLYYKTDFDGNNVQEFISTYEGENVICDGTYLYIDNYFALNLSQYIENDEPVNKDERYIKVYDSNMDLVDEFSFGDGSAKTWSILPVDDEVFMFSGKNSDGDFIFYYDKSEFSSLNGKLWEKTFAE